MRTSLNLNYGDLAKRNKRVSQSKNSHVLK